MSLAFRPLRAAFLLATLLAMPSAQANEASVRKSVAAFINAPESVVDSVTRIPQGGLYEVVLGNGELLYTDKAVSFIFIGNIIDTKTRDDLTRARLDKLAAVDLKTLPLDQAVKRVNGNGKRTLVTFEDPNCGYCKRLSQELQKVKDVTIYTFIYPILSADSEAKSRNVWCAEDKAAAWLSWMVDNKAPEARSCDSGAIDRNVVLGKKLRLSGTPVLYFADGSRVVGYREAADLEQALATIPAAGTASK